MKKNILALLITTAMISTSVQAFWAAAAAACNGPSVPGIFFVGEKFTQVHGKGIVMPHLKVGDKVASSNSSVISVVMHDGHIELTAKRPGTAELIITSPKGKERNRRTINVAYNTLADAPTMVHVGSKLYIKASAKRSEGQITVENTKHARIMRKKTREHSRFFVVKFHEAGSVKLTQYGKTKTFTVSHKSGHPTRNRKARN